MNLYMAVLELIAIMTENTCCNYIGTASRYTIGEPQNLEGASKWEKNTDSFMGKVAKKICK